jgi:hypothetical protein
MNITQEPIVRPEYINAGIQEATSTLITMLQEKPVEVLQNSRWQRPVTVECEVRPDSEGRNAKPADSSAEPIEVGFFMRVGERKDPQNPEEFLRGTFDFSGNDWLKILDEYGKLLQGFFSRTSGANWD